MITTFHVICSQELTSPLAVRPQPKYTHTLHRNAQTHVHTHTHTHTRFDTHVFHHHHHHNLSTAAVNIFTRNKIRTVVKPRETTPHATHAPRRGGSEKESLSKLSFCTSDATSGCRCNRHGEGLHRFSFPPLSYRWSDRLDRSQPSQTGRDK